MALSAELVALLLYAAQQFGIVLGVGAQTAALVYYLLQLHTPHVEHRGLEHSARFARAVGLLFIVLSGLAVTYGHYTQGEFNILFAPAFVIKWALILFLVPLHFVVPRMATRRAVGEGAEGALWYALFLIHTVAPVTTWAFLGVFVGTWAVLFGVVWAIFVLLLMPHTPKKAAAPQQVVPVVASVVVPKIVAPAPPPPPHKPVPPPPKPTPPPEPPKPAPLPPQPKLAPPPPILPVVEHEMLPPAAPNVAAGIPTQPTAPVHKVVTAVPAEQKFAGAKTIEMVGNHSYVGLPAIHVMPKTKEEVQGRLRDSVVQF